jgi:hypothetical protein
MKAVLALVSILVAVVSLYFFQTTDHGWLIYVVAIGALGTVVFGGIYMAGKINQDGNLHIGD